MHNLWPSDQVGPLTGNPSVGLVVADSGCKWRAAAQGPNTRHLPSAGNLVDPAPLIQEGFACAERQPIIKAWAEHLRKIVVAHSSLPDKEIQRPTDAAVHALE